MKLEKFYDHLYNWMIGDGPRFLIGILILVAGLWLIKLTIRWSHSTMHKQNVDPTVKPFLLNLVAVALRILLILAGLRGLLPARSK